MADNVATLVKALEDTALPYAAWKIAKSDSQKATATIRSKDIYTEPETGPELLERMKAFSVDTYTAMGEAGNGDVEILRQRLEADIGADRDGGIETA